jgi:molybdopterin synthase sulfur carrier subunit
MVTIAYFAWVRERMGVAEEQVVLPTTVVDAAGLVAWLATRDERGALALTEPERIRVAVDGVMVGFDAPLTEVREVALFPPVTGG